MTADIEAIIDEAKRHYEFVGLRTVEDGHDPLEESKVWIDGEITEDGVGGVCATDVDEFTAYAQHNMAEKNYRVGFYFGENTYIVAGNKSSYGDDLGEIVIEDAIVIAQVR